MSRRRRPRQKAIFLFCFGLAWLTIGVGLIIPPHLPRDGYWWVCAGFLITGGIALVAGLLGRTTSKLAWYGLYLMGGYAAINALVTYLQGDGLTGSHDLHGLLGFIADSVLMVAIGAVSNLREADTSLQEVNRDERH